MRGRAQGGDRGRGAGYVFSDCLRRSPVSSRSWKRDESAGSFGNSSLRYSVDRDNGSGSSGKHRNRNLAAFRTAAFRACIIRDAPFFTAHPRKDAPILWICIQFAGFQSERTVTNMAKTSPVDVFRISWCYTATKRAARKKIKRQSAKTRRRMQRQGGRS